MFLIKIVKSEFADKKLSYCGVKRTTGYRRVWGCLGRNSKHEVENVANSNGLAHLYRTKKQLVVGRINFNVPEKDCNCRFQVEGSTFIAILTYKVFGEVPLHA